MRFSAHPHRPFDFSRIDSIIEARRQLHHAVQTCGAVGNSLVPEVPDDTHTTLWWSEHRFALLTRNTPLGFWIGLRFEEPALIAVDANDEVVDTFELDGRRLQDAWDWLPGAIETASGAPLAAEIVARDYGIEDHPVANGEAFHLDADAVRALGTVYSNAHVMLSAFAEEEAHASLVRCWPHHFDIAVLHLLDPDEDPETARSINIGASPGDAGHPSPYFYVVPWPAPAEPELGPLEAGRWNTEGWLGAVLGYGELREIGNQDAQARALQTFLNQAHTSAEAMLG